MRMRFKQMPNGVGSYAVSNATRWFYALFCLFIGLGFVSVLSDGGLTAPSIVPPEFVRPKKLRIEENDMQDPSRVYFFAVLFIFERI